MRTIAMVILQADKFLKCDWLRPVVFKPDLKYFNPFKNYASCVKCKIKFKFKFIKSSKKNYLQ